MRRLHLNAMELTLVILGAGYCTATFGVVNAPLPTGVQPLGVKAGAYIHASGFAPGTLELAKTIFETAQKQCQVLRQREARIDSGRLEDVGLWQEDSYYTETQSATYATGALLVPTKDPCVFRQIYTHTLKIASFDGKRTRLVIYDSAKEDAISQYVIGKRLFTHLNPETRNGSGASAFVDAGSFDMVAGYRCRNMRVTIANALQEACFIEARGIPPYIQFMQLKLDLTYPGKNKHTAVVERLIPDALIDQGVFEVPKNIRMVERR